MMNFAKKLEVSIFKNKKKSFLGGAPYLPPFFLPPFPFSLFFLPLSFFPGHHFLKYIPLNTHYLKLIVYYTYFVS